MRPPAWCLVILAAWPLPAAATDPVVLAGPALGTTYRVTLARIPADTTAGELHREVDRLLAAIDREASTWRRDSDVSRFNRAAVGEWVEIGPHLAALLEVARRVHDESEGGFDATAAPLVRAWRSAVPPPAAAIEAARRSVGMRLVESRAEAAGRPVAVRKTAAGVELDLDGVGPGFAVDRIGARLAAAGSTDHLVELGGEVRAWGARAAGEPWRIALAGSGTVDHVLGLPAGRAVATATLREGRAVVDPRTGRMVAGPARSVTVVADTCAEADAWAVAALVLGLEPDERGLVHPRGPAASLSGAAARPPLTPAAPPREPSTPAAPPGATRGAP